MGNTDGMSDLMDHSPHVSHRITPAQVDAVVRLPVPPGSPSRGRAAARVEGTDSDVIAVGRASLHEADASFLAPVVDCQSKGFLPGSIQACLEDVGNCRVLLPRGWPFWGISIRPFLT